MKLPNFTVVVSQCELLLFIGLNETVWVIYVNGCDKHRETLIEILVNSIILFFHFFLLKYYSALSIYCCVCFLLNTRVICDNLFTYPFSITGMWGAATELVFKGQEKISCSCCYRRYLILNLLLGGRESAASNM